MSESEKRKRIKELAAKAKHEFLREIPAEAPFSCVFDFDLPSKNISFAGARPIEVEELDGRDDQELQTSQQSFIARLGVGILDHLPPDLRERLTLSVKCRVQDISFWSGALRY
jgi:hypothetical protein